MLKLNATLLSDLPRLLGERVVDFTTKVFGAGRKHMWNQMLDSHWKRLNCKMLVDISNAYHIPLAMFLVEEERTYASRLQLVLDFEWKEVRFTPFNIYDDYHADEPKYQLKQYADSIGVTTSCIYRWFAKGGTCTMSVEQALLMTYNLNIPLSFLFTDENLPLPSTGSRNANEELEKAVHELNQLRERIHQQQQQIRTLMEDNRKLQSQVSIVAEEDASTGIGDYNTRVRPWIWNQSLWNNLHTVLGLTKHELECMTCVSTKIATPTLPQLVSVCNALHISVRHFLLRSVLPPVIHSGDFYTDHHFLPITLRTDHLKAVFGVGNILGKKLQDTLALLDVSDMMVRRWERDDAEASTLPVTRLVDMCNALDLSPSICIIDPNAYDQPLTLTEALLEENMLLKKELYRQQHGQIKEE